MMVMAIWEAIEFIWKFENWEQDKMSPIMIKTETDWNGVLWWKARV